MRGAMVPSHDDLGVQVAGFVIFAVLTSAMILIAPGRPNATLKGKIVFLTLFLTIAAGVFFWPR